MLKRLALSGLSIFSVLILAASWIPGVVAEWTFALIVVSFPVGLIALGVRGGRSSRGLTGLLVLLWLVLTGSASAMLAWSGSQGSWLGLPAGAWWMLLGLGAAPLFLTGLGYAATFDRPPTTDRR